MTVLSHTFRDSSGQYHFKGEPVEIIKRQRRLGIHDEILVAIYQSNGQRTVLLPQDVEDSE